MAKTNKTDEEKCARKTLGPLLIAVSVLIFVTIVLVIYFADDIRRTNINRGQMRIKGFGSGGAESQSTQSIMRQTAFNVPWHSQQNPDAVTGASPKAMSFNWAIGIVSPSVVGIKTSGGQQQSASGIIINRQGYVLTNDHVVKMRVIL